MDWTNQWWTGDLDFNVKVATLLGDALTLEQRRVIGVPGVVPSVYRYPDGHISSTPVWYSTSREGCMDAVDRMRREGWGFSLRVGESATDGTSAKWTAAFFNKDRWFSFRHRTDTMAICLVLLQALEGQPLVYIEREKVNV